VRDTPLFVRRDFDRSIHDVNNPIRRDARAPIQIPEGAERPTLWYWKPRAETVAGSKRFRPSRKTGVRRRDFTWAKVRVAELFPFGAEEDRVGPPRRVVGVAAKAHIFELSAGPWPWPRDRRRSPHTLPTEAGE
jgi:hypothetical protein